MFLSHASSPALGAPSSQYVRVSGLVAPPVGRSAVAEHIQYIRHDQPALRTNVLGLPATCTGRRPDFTFNRPATQERCRMGFNTALLFGAAGDRRHQLPHVVGRQFKRGAGPGNRLETQVLQRRPVVAVNLEREAALSVHQRDFQPQWRLPDAGCTVIRMARPGPTRDRGTARSLRPLT